MVPRVALVSVLAAGLAAQPAPGKKDPLAEALGRPSGQGAATNFGAASIEAAFKGAQVDGARSMAAEVVGCLGTMTLEAEQALADLEEAKAAEARAWAELQRRQAEVDAYLAEYRQGLFCSGCQKSKSEIERRSERFPHPGQHIVQPTRDQIAAKERELQAGLDRLRQEAARAAERVRKLRQRVDDLLTQIPEGHALWRTAGTYARNLAARASAQAAYDLRRDLQEAERRLDGATGRWLAASQAPAREQAAKEKAAAQARLDQLRQRQRAEERRALQEEADLARLRKAQEEQIEGYLDRPRLRRNLALSPAFTFMNRMGSPESLGGRFLMGRLPAQSGGDTLPSVLRFIAEFRACDPSALRLRG